MSRWWTEFVAAVSDVISLGFLVLIMFIVAAIFAALWYWFPAWVPRRLPRLRWPRWRRPRWRWPRWRWPRWRLRLPRLRWPGWARLRLRWPRLRWLRWPWRRRKRGKEQTPELIGPAPSDELPELPVEAFVSLADRLAAEGRHAEAVRERLRAIVRDLVDHGAVEHRPGWTITELAGAASLARPAVSTPLDAAGRLFSDIWYGQRPATADHDARMRDYAAAVGLALAQPRVPVGATP
jgi:hypothetical protein